MARFELKTLTLNFYLGAPQLAAIERGVKKAGVSTEKYFLDAVLQRLEAEGEPVLQLHDGQS